jgi:DNA transposition AAA+ family ATPase
VSVGHKGCRTRRVPPIFQKIRIKIDKKIVQTRWAGAGKLKKVKKSENKKLERARFRVYIKVRENLYKLIWQNLNGELIRAKRKMLMETRQWKMQKI